MKRMHQSRMNKQKIVRMCIHTEHSESLFMRDYIYPKRREAALNLRQEKQCAAIPVLLVNLSWILGFYLKLSEKKTKSSFQSYNQYYVLT